MAFVAHHRSTGDQLGERYDGVRPVRADARFTLYSAREIATERQVHVKVPSDNQPWLGELLDDQARVLGALSAHPNVITVHQHFTLADGRPALVFEHHPTPLSRALHNGGRLPAREVASIGIKLAGALEAVHSTGVLHCDVRPNNIVRSVWDDHVLAGFDEAIRTHPGVASYAVLQATTAHTAPELLLGDEASVRTDVYGLGATLYELLAGRSAFRAYAGEPASAVTLRVIEGQVKPIVAPDVPLAMSDLLTWAMAGEPAKRPPSPSWLAEELGRIELEQDWPRTCAVG